MVGGLNELGKTQEVIFNGRTLLHKDEDFKLGVVENVKLNDKGRLVLQPQNLEGSYISPEIKAHAFKDLVSSWNAETPEGSQIEVLFQVKSEDRWSRWFSYGKWSSNGNRESVKEQRDEIAHMDTDTLIVVKDKELTGFRYKAILSRNDLNIESPQVKLITATLRLFESLSFELDENKNWAVELDVTERSQMIIPKIGNIICSPTSLSMVMEYYGKKLDTEEVASHVLDHGANIYGNWSYNVAYAGTRGFDAYVARYISADEIKDKIADGIPVIASIRTKNKEELTGTTMAYPGGHLLVVRGFTVKDGEEYVIVNDPAAPDHDTVRREYKLSEFEKVWGKIVYILTPDSE